MQIILKLTWTKYPRKNIRALWEQELLEITNYLVFSLSAVSSILESQGFYLGLLIAKGWEKNVCMVCVKHLLLQLNRASIKSLQ